MISVVITLNLTLMKYVKQKGNKMNKEKRSNKVFTELEKRLIDVIDNFILWNTTESDRGLAEEFIEADLSCDVDYNEWFELKKEFVGYHKIREDK